MISIGTYGNNITATGKNVSLFDKRTLYHGIYIN